MNRLLADLKEDATNVDALMELNGDPAAIAAYLQALYLARIEARLDKIEDRLITIGERS